MNDEFNAVSHMHVHTHIHSFPSDTQVTPQPLVRLILGSDQHSGRVQLLHEGVWGAVCGSGWSLQGANVVCKQLGFPGALQSLSGTQYGKILPDEPVWWTGLGCRGIESNVSACPGVLSSLEKNHTCELVSAASVICEGEAPSLTITYFY